MRTYRELHLSSHSLPQLELRHEAFVDRRQTQLREELQCVRQARRLLLGPRDGVRAHQVCHYHCWRSAES